MIYFLCIMEQSWLLLWGTVNMQCVHVYVCVRSHLCEHTVCPMPLYPSGCMLCFCHRAESGLLSATPKQCAHTNKNTHFFRPVCHH